MSEIETKLTQQYKPDWKKISLFSIFIIIILITDLYNIDLNKKQQADISDAINFPKIIANFDAIDDWEKQITSSNHIQIN